MRIVKRTVTVLQLTPEEVQSFEDMIHEAATGRTVHYSERQTGPNQHFGVSVSGSHRQSQPVHRGNGDEPVSVA